jgi:hypothetical protein
MSSKVASIQLMTQRLYLRCLEKSKENLASNFDTQEEMVMIMKLRRKDELKSQAISMRKDLYLSLAVLHSTWHELDKILITLEDSVDFETCPRNLPWRSISSIPLRTSNEAESSLYSATNNFSFTAKSLM